MPTASSYQLSRHAATQSLGADHYAVWNTFFPSVVIVDDHSLQLLRDLPTSISAFDRNARRRLMRHRIIYRGSGDPYEKEFFATADAALRKAAEEAEEFYGHRRPYVALTIANSGCNLGCSYCVSYAGDSFRTDATRTAEKGDTRGDIILSVVDQFIRRRVEHGESGARIAFNGGEILLRWPLIRRVLHHVRESYPDFEVLYGMNTNATLLSEDIARELSEFGVAIDVSVDGYKELHDSSRIYHGGAPSFDRVMEGVAHYNERSPSRRLTAFQGTIEDIDNFDAAKFAEMANFGFSSARLAPNILDAPPTKGALAATWEAQAVLNTQGQSISLQNTYLQKVLKKMRGRPKGFSPHCNGLSGNLRFLTLNVDSLQLSQMCSFVSPASMSLSDLDYDIYNRKLWNETYSYMKERIDMLRHQCAGCNVLGLCQGACVYNGLDLDNRLNPAGCSYQRTTWRHAVDLSFLGHIRPETVVEGVERASTAAAPAESRAAGSCCSDMGASTTTEAERRTDDGRTYLPLQPVS